MVLRPRLSNRQNAPRPSQNAPLQTPSCVPVVAASSCCDTDRVQLRHSEAAADPSGHDDDGLGLRERERDGRLALRRREDEAGPRLGRSPTRLGHRSMAGARCGSVSISRTTSPSALARRRSTCSVSSPARACPRAARRTPRPRSGARSRTHRTRHRCCRAPQSACATRT